MYWRGSRNCSARPRPRIRACRRASALHRPLRCPRRGSGEPRRPPTVSGWTTSPKGTGGRSYPSSNLALLPLLELVEELVLLLRGERLAVVGAGTLVEEAREDLAHLLLIDRHGSAAVALDPAVGRAIAAPARQLRR